MSGQAGRSQAAVVRRYGTAMAWALWLVALGALVFTATNVTLFATGHGVDRRIAWMLDPLVSVTLFAILIGEGVLARHHQQHDPVGPVKGSGLLKLFAGSATWLMNVWESVAAHDAAGIVLHSIVPALAVGLAELLPRYQARFNEIISRLESMPTLAQVRAEADRRLAAAVEQARGETAADAADRLSEALRQAETEASDRLTEAVRAARAETIEQATDRLSETVAQVRAEADDRLSQTVAQVRAEAALQQADAVAAACAGEHHQAEQRLAQALDQAHRSARAELREALATAERQTREALEQARTQADQRLTAAVEQARSETAADAADRLTEALRQAETEAADRLSETIARVRAEADQRLSETVAQARQAGRREVLAATTATPAHREATARPVRAGHTGRMRLVTPDEETAGSDELVLAALREAHRGLTPRQIGEITGLPRATVNRSLTRLQDEQTGRVAKVKHGLYQAAELDDAIATPVG